MAGRRLEREVVEILSNSGDADSARTAHANVRAERCQHPETDREAEDRGELELRTGNALPERS